MSELLLCIISGGVAASAIKAFESIHLWKLNRKAAKEDKEEERKDAKDNEHDEAIEELQKAVETLRVADRVILHDRIKYLGTAYIRDKAVSFQDRKDLIEMHDVYHNDLGGNGNLDYIMDEVKKLPMKDMTAGG